MRPRASDTAKSIENVARTSGRLLAGALVTLACAASIAGCRPRGDFGRYERSFFYDTAVPEVRYAVGRINGNTASAYPLTIAEEELRARSRTLRELGEPSLEREFDEIGNHLGIDGRDYQRERRVEHSTGAATLAAVRDVRTPEQLLSAIALDLELLDPYEAVAVEVYEDDGARLQALRNNGDVPADDVLNAAARVRENRSLVEDTILAVHNRIDDYEIEMRRSLLVHPYGLARDISNAIGRLAHRVHKLERRLRSVNEPDQLDHYQDLAG